jgi:hypothetical protein
LNAEHRPRSRCWLRRVERRPRLNGSLLHYVLGLSPILEHGVSEASRWDHDRFEQSLEGDLVSGFGTQDQIGLAWHSQSFVTLSKWHELLRITQMVRSSSDYAVSDL